MCGVEPRVLPPYPFELEATSLTIDQEPWVIGNRLLEIFGEAKGFIGKVNTSKYTIIFDAFSDDFAHCKMKVSIYKLLLGYAVDFQRRRGCCVFFNHLFKGVQAQIFGEPIRHAVAVSMPTDDPILYGPVLDMLTHGHVILQAEACRFLATLVCGQQQHEVLTVLADARGALEDLSCSDDIATSYPASEILCRLQE